MSTRDDDTVKAGRILARALVVIGGAAAACALAWLTATASASTVTQIADDPVGTAVAIGDPVPPVVPGALAEPARLAGLVKSRVSQAIPATVGTVGRIALGATGRTGPASPVKGPSGHAAKPAGPGAAKPVDASPAREDSVPRQRSAGLFPATAPVRAAAATDPLPVDLRADHGVDGPGGPSWPPVETVSANAGPASGHDRGCGDVAPFHAVERPQFSDRRNAVSHRAVASAEIRPGVTPD